MCTSFYMPFSAYKLSGRTMDFEKKPVNAYIYFMPKGEDYIPKLVRDAVALEHIHLYKPELGNQYAFVGAANEFGIFSEHTETRMFADGLNEKGISVSMQWLPGSKFPYQRNEAVKKEKGSDQLFLNWYLASYILGNVGSLNDLPGLFESDNPILKVFEIDQLLGKPVSLPFHFNVQDNSGRSMVIEFEGEDGEERGKVRIYDSEAVENSFLRESGGLSNYPFYHRQASNYQAFLDVHENISPVNQKQEPGQPQEVNGSGLRGMPGDGTPISRFVRTNLLMKTVYTEPKNDMDAVGATIQMLGSVAVPIGTIAPHDNPEKFGDSTLWSAVRDHKHLKYYFYDQHNNQLRLVDLKKLVEKGVSKRTSIKLETDESWYFDKTFNLES